MWICKALGGARGLVSRMTTQGSLLGSASPPLSPGPSLLAPGCAALLLASSSPGLSPTEKVLSCLFPADSHLGSQPPSTDLAVTSFIPFLWEVSVGFRANPFPISSSQTVREHLECYSILRQVLVFPEAWILSNKMLRIGYRVLPRDDCHNSWAGVVHHQKGPIFLVTKGEQPRGWRWFRHVSGGSSWVSYGQGKPTLHRLLEVLLPLGILSIFPFHLSLQGSASPAMRIVSLLV